MGDPTKQLQLGIIKNVGFGTRDVGRACLYFDVYLDETSAALQILGVEDAVKMIEAYRAEPF